MQTYGPHFDLASAFSGFFVNVAMLGSEAQVHLLIDKDSVLFESWSDDFARCCEAELFENVTYRLNSETALEHHQRAINNGIVMDWLAFDMCGRV